MDCYKPLRGIKALLLCGTALALIIKAVSSQPEKIGYIGGKVLLPCIYDGQLPDPVNVSWRDKDNKVVLDIINGKEEKEDDRVSGDEDQYKRGDFSILIRNLTPDDTGLYECNIHGVPDNNIHETYLTVTEKPADEVTSPRPAAPLTSAPSDPAVTTSLWLGLPFAVMMLLCIILIILFIHFT